MKTATADDRAQMAELVESHQADVWRYLRFLGSDPAEADDLVQETFLAVFRGSFEARTAAQTAGYLRKVARNQLLIARRRQRRGPSVVELDAAEAVWSRAAGEDGLGDYLAALEQCLEGTITPRVRQAIELQYGTQASRTEIAAALGMAVEGVKTLLRRARTALRGCIERRLGR